MNQCVDLFAQSCSFWSWLSNWQTLAAGMLALVAGVGSIVMINRQIRTQDQLHESTRDSRFSVAKAKTPLAAVELADHAKSYLVQAERLASLVLSRERQPFAFEGPKFPDEAAKVLDQLVESTNKPIVIEIVSMLYAEHQVMAHRLSNVPRPREHAAIIDDYLIQPIILDALAMNLLAFARDGVDLIRPSWDDIENRVRWLVQDSELKQRLKDYIADRKARGRPVPFALNRYNDR